ncbi:MAG: hypothetical protein QOH89_3427, partial [Pseudonocardiales bacterium]|nr:hypothetical protein [Pseudonocardiales bacterium]
ERTFRAGGMPATYDGAGALHSGGHHYGLHNLAAAVSRAPWRKWPDLVDRHVAAMAEIARATDRPIADGQKLLKLRAETDLPEPPDFDAPSGLPGILALPAVDLPTHVQELMKSATVDELGGLEEFLRLGIENLRRLPSPSHQALRADEERADSEVHIFTSDDFFGASRVLVLDHLLASALRTERPSHGCLVAVPNRHLLAVHLVSGMGVLAAIKLLVHIAEGEQDAPGPISDCVFYLPKDGPGQRLTERDETGVRIIADGAFAEALAGLGLIEESP